MVQGAVFEWFIVLFKGEIMTVSDFRGTDICYADDFVLQEVFILDNMKALFVWVGSEASVDERKNAMSYAHVSLPQVVFSLSIVFYLTR